MRRQKRAVRLQGIHGDQFRFDPDGVRAGFTVRVKKTGRAVALLSCDQQYKVTKLLANGDSETFDVFVPKGDPTHLKTLKLDNPDREPLTRGLDDTDNEQLTRGLIDGDNFNLVSPQDFGTIDVYGTIFQSRTERWERTNLKITLLELLSGGDGGLAIPTSSEEATVDDGRVSFTLFADALYSFDLPDGSQYTLKTPSPDLSPVPLNRLLDEFTLEGIASAKITPIGELVTELENEVNEISGVKASLDAFMGDFAHKVEVVLPAPDSNGETSINLGDLFKISISGIDWDDVISSFGDAILDTELGEALTTDLEPRVATLESQVTTLEPRVTTLEPQVATLESQVTTLEPRVVALESQVTTLEPRVVTLEPQVAALESQVATLEPRVATLEPRVATLETQVAALDSKVEVELSNIGLDMAKIKLNQLTDQQRIGNMESVQASLASDIETEKLVRAALTLRVEELESSSASTSARQDSTDLSGGQLTEIVTRLDSLSTSIVQAMAAIERLESSIQWNSNRLATLEAIGGGSADDSALPADPLSRVSWHDLTVSGSTLADTLRVGVDVTASIGFQGQGLVGSSPTRWGGAIMLTGATIGYREELKVVFKIDRHVSPSFFLGVAPPDTIVSGNNLYEQPTVCVYVSSSDNHYFYGSNGFRSNIKASSFTPNTYYEATFSQGIAGGIGLKLVRLLENNPSSIAETMIDISDMNSDVQQDNGHCLYIVPAQESASWEVTQIGLGRL